MNTLVLKVFVKNLIECFYYLEDKKSSPNCRTLSLIVTLVLDESKTTNRDLEEIKEFLRKISQTCNPSQTK